VGIPEPFGKRSGASKRSGGNLPGRRRRIADVGGGSLYTDRVAFTNTGAVPVGAEGTGSRLVSRHPENEQESGERHRHDRRDDIAAVEHKPDPKVSKLLHDDAPARWYGPTPVD